MEKMEQYLKELKEKVSIDNIVSLMKDAKIIEEGGRIKEEDVRQTLQLVDEKVTCVVDQSKQVADAIGIKMKGVVAAAIVEMAKSTAMLEATMVAGGGPVQQQQPAGDGTVQESDGEDTDQ